VYGTSSQLKKIWVLSKKAQKLFISHRTPLRFQRFSLRTSREKQLLFVSRKEIAKFFAKGANGFISRRTTCCSLRLMGSSFTATASRLPIQLLQLVLLLFRLPPLPPASAV
jgi:hypothetical protein